MRSSRSAPSCGSRACRSPHEPTLFKNEAVAKDSPFRSGPLKTETDVTEIVFEWVHWYNNERLHSALDHQTPEEYEQTYYDLQIGPLPDDAANKQAA